MGEPAWAIATLFPEQGSWNEDDYLRLLAEASLGANPSRALRRRAPI